MSVLRRLALSGLVTFVTLCPVRADTLHVFAAASLTESFKEVGAAFEKAHPGDTVELNFAGSQILRTQIEQGAPADVFASADLPQLEPLRRAGVIGPYRIFAHNRLVVVVPASHPKVHRLQDLARPGIRVIVAGPTVPVGRYTAQVETKMNASGLYGDDFSARVAVNTVSQETNVRAVLAKVALGEADAGFVYLTDAATARGRVRTLPIPARLNVVAIYPIAVVTRSPAREKAGEFMAAVLSPAGQAVLQHHGFEK